MRSQSSIPLTRHVLSEISISTTVPEPLAKKLRQLSQLECSTIAATTRRILAVSIDRELAALSAEGR